MPPLTSPSDRYRALAADLAYYASTPPRKGRKQERKREIADLERKAEFALQEIASECRRLWTGATANGIRLAAKEVDAVMRSKLEAA
jgi:hypothetical protein